ncbi:probable G-protein coupled receptor CG31760 [Octopus vulgaris]|uniref:Probable G-protein coupled receptor CG31760 n=1 Tax=Octopus vulgaris TaxID=6645 RepID=A0AA36EXT3_OCTVU|nr:probable G-protein coupled receptor CG31760 [Octopus vulgaris]
MDWLYAFFIFLCLGKHIYWLLETVSGFPIENSSQLKSKHTYKETRTSNASEQDLNLDDRITELKKALEYVERLNASNCKNGTSDTLALRLDRTVWDQYAKVALKTANFVSKYLQIKSINGSLTNDVSETLNQEISKSSKTRNDFGHITNDTSNQFVEPLSQDMVDDDIRDHCSSLDDSTNKEINSSFDENLRNVSDILTIFYLLVQNNIDTSSKIIVGSALALEPYVIPGLEMFSPYAHKTSSTCINLEDLALKYNYMDKSVQWYFSVAHNLNESQIETETVKFGDMTVGIKKSGINTYAVASLANGYWTNPYFDCGGGNIWMVTFSAPILWISPNRKIYFRGVATIDIELTNIDINQCDVQGDITQDINQNAEAKKMVDIFRGTHSCQKTTKCVHVPKCGFRRGCYICKCLDGYYFPYKDQHAQYFNGSDLEDFYGQNKLNSSNELNNFQCLPCARYCDTCIDSSPCMHQPNIAIRVMILVMSAITLLIMIALAVVVCHKRSQLVIKSASPIFLLMMCLGGSIMSFEEFILYFEPTDLICQVTIWWKHLGFVVMYGALILKTWRISIIFKEGKVKRVNLPDTALLQRMIPVLAVTIAGLMAWTLDCPPEAVLLETTTSLKYITCSVSLWMYAFYAGEAIMLLYSVYLCFTVRKAPAFFNESRYITWSTYNTLILGSFLIIFQQFVKSSVGPDIMYLLHFLSLQITSTITVGLIFIPKFYILYKIKCGQNVEMDTEHTVTGRRIRKNAVVSNLQEKSSQTDEISKCETCNCTRAVEDASSSINFQQLSSNTDVPKKSKHSGNRSSKHHRKSRKNNRVEPTLKTNSTECDQDNKNDIN